MVIGELKAVVLHLCHTGPALGQNEKRNRKLASSHSSSLGTEVWELKEQRLLLNLCTFSLTQLSITAVRTNYETDSTHDMNAE